MSSSLNVRRKFRMLETFDFDGFMFESERGMVDWMNDLISCFDQFERIN